MIIFQFLPLIKLQFVSGAESGTKGKKVVPLSGGGDDRKSRKL